MKFLNLLFVLAFVFTMTSCGGADAPKKGGDKDKTENVDKGDAGKEEGKTEEGKKEEKGDDHEGHDHGDGGH